MLAQRRPETVAFRSDVVRRTRSTVCSSESCGDRVWVTPTVEDCDNVDHGFFDPVVDRKWKSPRQFAVQAKDLCVYSRLAFKAIKILEQTVREVITETFALLLVEPSTFKQIAAGFSPKLDAH
jgi:hypothetical protein